VVSELRERFQVPQIVVVAHSMGGLVAREIVLELAKGGSERWVSTLVTISTPYGGHSGAQLGARYALDTVPSWIDLAPNSEFLQSLRQRLPRDNRFLLMFTYGGRTGSLDRSSDGTVPVASQLPPWVQSDADRLYGFDCTHTDVLSDPDALSTLRHILQPAKPTP
jgi:pimeloyl-ACP methyl ester carboxylesterase